LFYEGISRVQKNRKCGYIDKKGKTVVEFEYDWANDLNEGLAAVKKDGKWGILEIQSYV
jgi:hypothetical protein